MENASFIHRLRLASGMTLLGVVLAGVSFDIVHSIAHLAFHASFGGYREPAQCAGGFISLLAAWKCRAF